MSYTDNELHILLMRESLSVINNALSDNTLQYRDEYESYISLLSEITDKYESIPYDELDDDSRELLSEIKEYKDTIESIIRSKE